MKPLRPIVRSRATNREPKPRRYALVASESTLPCSIRIEKDAAGQWQRVYLTIVAVDKAGILIPPRTKKTHNEMITLKNGRTMMMPSKQYREWEKAALRSIRPYLYGMRDLPIVDAVNCEAKVYRERNSGDDVGFYQALSDFLQAAGILKNDAQIKRRDGSDLLKDPLCPRYEVCLTFLYAGKKPKIVARVEPRLPDYSMPLFAKGNKEC